MNGFEIRTEILKLAKDYMDKQAQANLDYIAALNEVNVGLAQGFAENIKPFYSLDELQKTAEKMYQGFVAKRD
jgi:hypothetical protein